MIMWGVVTKMVTIMVGGGVLAGPEVDCTTRACVHHAAVASVASPSAPAPPTSASTIFARPVERKFPGSAAQHNIERQLLAQVVPHRLLHRWGT